MNVLFPLKHSLFFLSSDILHCRKLAFHSYTKVSESVELAIASVGFVMLLISISWLTWTCLFI